MHHKESELIHLRTAHLSEAALNLLCDRIEALNSRSPVLPQNSLTP
jgi:hypothetical protein